jgi:hypothetical protein
MEAEPDPADDAKGEPALPPVDPADAPFEGRRAVKVVSNYEAVVIFASGEARWLHQEEALALRDADEARRATPRDLALAGAPLAPDL